MKTIALLLAPDDLGSVPVFGQPAIRRLVMLLRKRQVEEIHVLGQTEALAPLLSDLLPPSALHPLADRGDLEALVAALPLPGRCRLLAFKANTILDSAGLSQFLEAAESPGLHTLCGEDGKEEAECSISGPAGDVLPLLAALWEKSPEERLPATVRRLTGKAGLPHLVEDGADALRTAEKKLVASLAFQSPDDGLLARHFSRKVSRRISPSLARLGVSPNGVTLGGVLIGSAGAFLLSRTGYWPHLAGALLFLFCVIVDGVDGEVARLRMKESAFGHYLDVITDNLVHFGIFIGIAFGLFHDSGNPVYLHALEWMMGGFLLCLIAVYQCILRRSPEELAQSPKVVRLMALLSNRDFAYLVAFLAVIGRLNWFLLGAAAGSYLFAATLWIIGTYESRSAPLSETP